MNDIAISVKNLTKKYRIFGHPGDRIKQALTFGRMRFHREFTALQDVSFEIKKGEAVGIIGRNGSGKSTLLQLVCGILRPTSGEVRVNGRISALLELGAGFNPEFTGRENVYFQGAVIGVSMEEMERRFDDITAFADIGEFIDQPVRTYSSGMFVRLAFAVAVSVEPDILVVDEALSVGDEAFQRKCFARIRMIQEQGGTILFVSHSTSAILELCDRAFLMDYGRLLFGGVSKTIVANYQRLLFAPPEGVEPIRWVISDERTIPENHEGPLIRGMEGGAYFDPSLVPASTLSYERCGAEILDSSIFGPGGEKVNVLVTGEKYIFSYRIRFNEDANNIKYGMMIKSASGYDLGGLLFGRGEEGATKGMLITVRFAFFCHLLPGTYFMNAGVLGCVHEMERFLHRIIDVTMFRVQGVPDVATGMIDFSTDDETQISNNECGDMNRHGNSDDESNDG